jgi:predicted ArsR family transcriptional regulator
MHQQHLFDPPLSSLSRPDAALVRILFDVTLTVQQAADVVGLTAAAAHERLCYLARHGLVEQRVCGGYRTSNVGREVWAMLGKHNSPE